MDDKIESGKMAQTPQEQVSSAVVVAIDELKTVVAS